MKKIILFVSSILLFGCMDFDNSQAVQSEETHPCLEAGQKCVMEDNVTEAICNENLICHTCGQQKIENVFLEDYSVCLQYACRLHANHDYASIKENPIKNCIPKN